MGANPDKELEFKNRDLFAGQWVSSNHHQSTRLGSICSSCEPTNHSDMSHGGTTFVDNANGHIKIVFEDCFTTVSNSEGAIAANKWRIIAQHRPTRERIELDDDTNHDLADEWLTPDKAKVRSQQQHQDASQCPTPTDWDPNHFQWRRQQPPPSTPIAGLVERGNLGQSSLLTTSGASAAHHVSFSSKSPTWDPRHTPCRSSSILWDNQHQPSILWDNQHQSFGTININICQSNHPMLLMPHCLCVWHPTGPDKFTNNHQDWHFYTTTKLENDLEMESPLTPVPTILLNNLNMKQHWNKCETSLSITLFGMAILQNKSQSMKMFGMTITWVLWKHLDFALHLMHKKGAWSSKKTQQQQRQEC